MIGRAVNVPGVGCFIKHCEYGVGMGEAQNAFLQTQNAVIAPHHLRYAEAVAEAYGSGLTWKEAAGERHL